MKDGAPTPAFPSVAPSRSTAWLLGLGLFVLFLVVGTWTVLLPELGDDGEAARPTAQRR